MRFSSIELKKKKRLPVVSPANTHTHTQTKNVNLRSAEKCSLDSATMMSHM